MQEDDVSGAGLRLTISQVSLIAVLDKKHHGHSADKPNHWG